MGISSGECRVGPVPSFRGGSDATLLSPTRALSLDMPRELLHVQPDADRWIVCHNGEVRASLLTRTRAVTMARERAKALGAALTIADEAGRIVERRTYGREPRAGKG